MKANFDTEQPKVKIVKSNNTVYIFICVNGKWVEREYDPSSVPQKTWECDYREIVTSVSDIDLEDVEDNPENYLNWEKPEVIPNKDIPALKKQIASLEEKNEFLRQCILEMSEFVYQ